MVPGMQNACVVQHDDLGDKVSGLENEEEWDRNERTEPRDVSQFLSFASPAQCSDSCEEVGRCGGCVNV